MDAQQNYGASPALGDDSGDISRGIFGNQAAAANREHVDTTDRPSTCGAIDPSSPDATRVAADGFGTQHDDEGGDMNSKNPQSGFVSFADAFGDIFKDISETQAIKPAHADSHDTAKNQRAKTKRLNIDEINALNRHIADTWTPAMDEEIERATRQDRLARCAKLTEEKAMCAAQRAQLTRDLKKAVAVKLRGDSPDVDAELARIRAALADLYLHELNAAAELRAVRTQLRQA